MLKCAKQVSVLSGRTLFPKRKLIDEILFQICNLLSARNKKRVQNIKAVFKGKEKNRIK